MDINKLQYFLCVCKHLNFTKAAEELYVTAQGLNVAISRMEKDLNTKLFMRTSKGLVLTDSGFYLRETAENIVGEFYRYQHKIHNKDTINVVCMTHVFTQLPYSVQRLLFNLNPAFDVALSEGFCNVCEEKLQRGEVDFAIAVPLASNMELDARKLFSSRIIAVVNKDSPLAGEEYLTVDMMEGIKFITTGNFSKTQQILMSQLQQRGIPPKLAFSYYTPASIIQIVNDHPEIIGILMDYFMVGAEAPNILVKQFDDPHMGFDISLIKNATRVQSKHALQFENHFFLLMREA